MSDPTFDPVAQSFDAADSAAYAAINAANTAEATPPVAAPTEAPLEEETPAVVPEVAPTQPKVAALSDDDLVEVLVNGQPVQKPWKEARASLMMHADYTRKTQEVAAARKELESTYQQMVEREQKIAAFLQNPTAVQDYLQKIQQQQVQQNPQITSNELVSYQDVQRLLQQEMVNAQQKLEQAVVAKTQELHTMQQASAIQNDLNATVKALKTQYPALESIDGIDQMLFNKVNAMGPTSVEEAKQFFATVAKAQMDALESHFVSLKKQEAVAKAKVTKQGIEPSGTGVLPSPKVTKKFDDPEAFKNATAQIQALIDAGK